MGRTACENLPGVSVRLCVKSEVDRLSVKSEVDRLCVKSEVDRLCVKSEVDACRNVSMMPGHRDKHNRQTDELVLMDFEYFPILLASYPITHNSNTSSYHP